MLCAFKMLKLYDLRFYLLNEETLSRNVVADFLVVAGECLGKGDSTLVVDEQERWR